MHADENPDLIPSFGSRALATRLCFLCQFLGIPGHWPLAF